VAADDAAGRGPPPVWFSALPAEARAYQGRRAGLVSRLAANVVDAGVLAVSFGALYLAASALMFATDPVRFTFPTPARGVLVSVGVVLALAYFTVCWAATGRTFGDQLLGLRVVGRRGSLPRFGIALLRAVCSVFFPAGLLWVLVGAQRRSVADVVLRTAVIYDWNPHARSPGTGR
jgi:uncharacterized RDD family membrane protein YckC